MLFSRALSHASVLVSRAASNSTPLADPVSVDPSQAWDGNDGQWSSFVFRLGRPLQQMRVFPSTAAYANWVTYQNSLSCSTYTPIPPGTGATCQDSRGGLFNQNASYSWVPNSAYNIGVGDALGLDPNALFGYDDMYLGYSSTTEIPHQIVALNINSYLWIGGLALNPRPANFTDFNNPQNSTLATMRHNNYIPSLSYGYTAGAYYRYSRVLGSLILGGYDANLFTPGGLSIGMAADDARDLVVGLRSISSNSTSAKLLPGGPVLSFVDSTYPFIWLPLDACQAFEQAFNLTWDPNAELYLLTASEHEALVRQNPAVTFEIGSGTTGGATNKIELPYAAFDQNVSFPWIPQNQTTTYYFPLKRADNYTQYTLGRTLLQEAYLSVDYERRNFSLTQRPWAPDQQANQKVTAVYPVGVDVGGGGLSAGAIAGIVVGVVAALAVVTGLGVWYFFRQRKARRARDAALMAAAADKDQKADMGSDSSGDRNSRATANNEYFPAEPKLKLDSGTTHRAPEQADRVHELNSPREIHEAPNAADGEGGKAPHGELAGSGAGAWEADSNMRFELPGSDVPLGMSEKLGGAKLVGWDGRTAAHGAASPDRVLSSRDTASRSPTARSPTARSRDGQSPR